MKDLERFFHYLEGSWNKQVWKGSENLCEDSHYPIPSSSKEFLTVISPLLGEIYSFMDLGCSYGMKLELVRYFGAVDVFGVDHNTMAIELGKTIFPEVTFYNEDFFSLTDAYSNIDIFFTYQPYVLTEDVIEMLNHVHKYAKKGSKVIYFPTYVTNEYFSSSLWDWEQNKRIPYYTTYIGIKK